MNIKIFLIFFSLIFSNVLLAEHAGFQSENNREISWGKLRWFLPADRWSIAEQFVRKGKFFSISMTSNDDLPVKIFGSPSRNGRPDFIFTGAIRFPGSDFFCKRTPSLNNSIAKKFAECSLFFCFERTGEKVIPLIPPDLDNTWERFNLRTAEDLGPCPVHLNYYDQISLNDERKNELRFGFIDINEKEKFLNIEVNGFRKYLDISFCRNLSDSGRLHCNIVNIERSILEEQILEMERVKKNKSIIALNDLITNLLPCVKKKDKNCIKSYFVSESNLKEDYSSLKKIPFGDPNIDESLISELEACLSYKNLLPHLFATRGINKICVFDSIYFKTEPKPPKGNSKLIGVMYPEAFRLDRNHDEVMYVKID